MSETNEQKPWYFIRNQGMWWQMERSVILQIGMTEDGMFLAETSDWMLTSNETTRCKCSSLQAAKDWCERFLKKAKEKEVDSEQ